MGLTGIVLLRWGNSVHMTGVHNTAKGTRQYTT